jgi:hypothetical protein
LEASSLIGGGLTFRITNDGMPMPCDQGNGPASLGMMTLTVTKFGTDSLSTIVALVLSNAAIPFRSAGTCSITML